MYRTCYFTFDDNKRKRLKSSETYTHLKLWPNSKSSQSRHTNNNYSGKTSAGFQQGLFLPATLWYHKLLISRTEWLNWHVLKKRCKKKQARDELFLMSRLETLIQCCKASFEGISQMGPWNSDLQFPFIHERSFEKKNKNKTTTLELRRTVFISRVGCCSGVHSCNHLVPLWADAAERKKEQKKERQRERQKERKKEWKWQKKSRCQNQPQRNVVFVCAAPLVLVLTHSPQRPSDVSTANSTHQHQ